MNMTQQAQQLGRQAVSMYCQTDGMYYSLLSKRELFAAMAMQGLLANSNLFLDDYSKIAISNANALLEELSKTNDNE